MGLLAGCAESDHESASSQSESHSATATSDVNEFTELPELNESEQIRQSVAETEGQIVQRLTLLSSLATRCPDCSTALLGGTSASQQRLELSGGLWDPWSGYQLLPWSEWRIEELPETPEPGFTVLGVADYMSASSADLLTRVVVSDSVEPQDRVTFAGILADRLVSAHQLEYAFNLEVSPGSDLSTEEAASDTEGELPANPTAEASESESLVQFDCLAAAFIANLPREEGAALSAEARFAEQVQNRTVQLSVLGVQDLRTFRCDLVSNDPTTLMIDLLRTDVELMSSANTEIRQLAGRWISEDTPLVAELAATSQTSTVLSQLLTPSSQEDGVQTQSDDKQ